MKEPLVVFGLALAVRLAFCFVAVPALGLPLGPATPEFFTSTDGYIDLAVNLVEHGQLAFDPEAEPTTFRGPAYPAAIALGYVATGDPGTAVLLVNSLASAATCAILFALARRALPRRAARWSAAVLIGFPLAIYYSASSFSDTFLAFTVVAYVAATLVMLARPTLGRAVPAGIAFAVTALTKIVILPFAGLLVLYAAWRRRAAVGPAALAAVLGLGLIGAWGARGHAVSGAYGLPTGGLGFNLLVGNFAIESSAGGDAAFRKAKAQAFARVRRDHGVEVTGDQVRPRGYYEVPPALDRLFAASALRMFIEDPLLLPRKLAINVWRFWYASSTPGRSAANLVVNCGVLLLAGLALWRLGRTRPVEAGWLAVFVAVYVLIYAAIFTGSSRYALPVLLLLAPLAPAAIVDSARDGPARAS